MIPLKKIITAEQIARTDAHTIESQNIESIELMEKASTAFVQCLFKHVEKDQNIIVFCGVGNNGGDGLAIARLLLKHGFNVQPVLVKIKDDLSKDCAINLKKLSEVLEIENAEQIPSLHEHDVVVDALFGTGLNAPIRGLTKKVIKEINAAEKKVFSVDIPSGLFCDELSEGDVIVENSHVISFQRPKFAFFLTENAKFIKSWEVVDIGLEEDFIQQLKTNHFIIDDLVEDRIFNRSRWSHKGTYGHALVMAGARGKIGAAILAGGACLRSGAGLVTMYVPKCG